MDPQAMLNLEWFSFNDKSIALSSHHQLFHFLDQFLACEALGLMASLIGSFCEAGASNYILRRCSQFHSRSSCHRGFAVRAGESSMLNG
jgi:hypothetical protein